MSKVVVNQKPKKRVSPMLHEAQTMLEHNCRLEFTATTKHFRMSSIICTISRASQNVETILKMMQAGMNIVRLNFSHDSQEFHAKTINTVRQAAAKYSEELGYTYPVSLAVDTKGPEIRTGDIEYNNEVELRKNDTLRLSTNRDLIDKGNRDVVYVDYPNIIYVVNPGNIIYLNDGAIKLVCKEVAVDCLICTVEIGGPLGSRKNVSMPEVQVDLPTVSEKDRVDLKFGVNHAVDFVFAAAIRSAAAISEIRGLLGEKGKEIKIFAKIENAKGLENIDEIIAAADGVLIARADIGVQVPMHKLFLAQKAAFARCNRAGKPVICGTQILDSMQMKSTPTRSEVADMGNAILDGADCIMLSSETAIGRYPVECVKVLNEVICEAELALWYRFMFEDIISRNPISVDASHAVAIGAVNAAKKSMATAIIVLTTSGRSAHLIAKYRPRCPVLAVTRCPRTARQCNVYRGIVPILYSESIKGDWMYDVESRAQYAMTVGKKAEIIQDGDALVVLSPWKESSGFANNIRIVYAYFESEWTDCMVKTDKKSNSKSKAEKKL